MQLVRLMEKNIRIIKEVELEPGNGLNVFFGKNGSGKTSMLEGIYLLGVGRSFRTRKLDKLVRNGETELSVYGEISTKEKGVTKIGIGKCRGKKMLKWPEI